MSSVTDWVKKKANDVFLGGRGDASAAQMRKQEAKEKAEAEAAKKAAEEAAAQQKAEEFRKNFKFAKGGKVDGIAKRGKTRGRYI